MDVPVYSILSNNYIGNAIIFVIGLLRHCLSNVLLLGEMTKYPFCEAITFFHTLDMTGCSNSNQIKVIGLGGS